MSQARFRKRGPVQRAVAGLTIAVSLAIVIAAERDLRSRSPDEMRGSKPLWRLLSLNALGALAYLRWGRRR